MCFSWYLHLMKTTYLLQESLLRLFVKTYQLFHNHHLPSFFMCHLDRKKYCSKCFEESPIKMKRIMKECGTLTACPKHPLPSTSPWMRSEGLKMRWVRSPGSTRRDSERTMSLFGEKIGSVPGGIGHLSMLQLRLGKKRRMAREKGISHEIE